ncbi:MAG: helix-turn-helix domain-containing protein [Richelia sp. RM2_1_2]|nr:helix-turn-helix domain-containing protein [Richelia sp. SM1_7_0]NJO60803.1 helix-turn-helix domain-containing protein [Richelia sp. RM2_1_2]
MSFKKKFSEKSQESNSPAVVKTPPTSVAFIHNFLDEYGLDPYEFRIYAHMVRRTGGKTDGVCFASLKKIAKICDMSVRKAQQALKLLINAQLLKQDKRDGRTDLYKVTPASEWAASEELEKIREAVADGKDVVVNPDGSVVIEEVKT